MRTKKTIWIVCGCLAAVTLIAGVVPLILARPSNCGGNSAALANCNQILVCVRLSCETKTFLLNTSPMSAEERDHFLELGVNHWTGEAQYWVRTNRWDLTSRTQMVVFCEKAFANVPQPTFFNFYKRNPAYAVGFADGTAQLISPADFAQLDKSDFAPLSALRHIYQP
ncbi:MAG: hypothetical protein AAB370_06500 [Verrucomicrobiota bacterium]